MNPINQPALLKFLETENKMLFGKSIEIHDAIKDWLTYIPQSFPHYTQHTIEHSDEIILQISKLIFENNDSTQPVVQLSTVEAYILVAAAYLHDSGMVVSDKEKTDIIQSEEWISWTTEGSGTKRWKEIIELRSQTNFSNPDVKNFVADLQTRFLIAEFVRRRHHTRAGSIIAEYQPLLGRFAFDNRLLLQAISNVCIGHGLDKYDLEDKKRFPDRSDILGESVNVRFLAILLRLGDLLDMRSDRACPLLLNAANPLPSDSLAHWTQYQRLTHRLTATDRIEITAECENQEEHRFLQDWCQWLVNETKNARELMARCARHNLWKPPFASLDGDSRTITIQPSKSAKYIPNEWTFQLDQDVVYERLIRDLYADENVFVRELLQNSFDATRCKLYDDLKSANLETPEYPTQVSKEWLEKYHVNVSLETRPIQNELSGEKEEIQFIIIEDFGIGMDQDIIEHYLLQVGHSFYTTEEFRRNYRFVGTSRFGLGFLSVFAVSDSILVETFKPTSERKNGAMRLVLTGPRNYLLTERCDRNSSGTKIEIRLKKNFEPGELTKLISKWCKRIEFSITVNDFDQKTIVTAEKAEKFIQEVTLISNPAAKFFIKIFPINLPGVNGEIYILSYFDGDVERWDENGHRYINTYPHAIIPTCPENLVCLHGIYAAAPYTSERERFSLRVDYRNDKLKPALSRNYFSEDEVGFEDSEILALIERVLREHIATSPLTSDENSGWLYKQRLFEKFSIVESFWNSIPKTVRVTKRSRPQLLSLDELKETQVFLSCFGLADAENPKLKDDLYFISPENLRELTDFVKYKVFSNRRPISVKKTRKGFYIISWGIINGDEAVTYGERYDRPASYVHLPSKRIGIKIHNTHSHIYPHILLNLRHPFANWLKTISDESIANKISITEYALSHTLELTLDAITFPSRPHRQKIIEYVNKWSEIPNLPSNLIPPKIGEEDFDSNLYQLENHSKKIFKGKSNQKQEKKSKKTSSKKIVKKLKK